MKNPVAFLCVVMGMLIVVSRGPMMFAPKASLRFFRQLVSTDVRVRILGLVMAPLSLALGFLPLGEEGAAALLRSLGWLFILATSWLLIAPGMYRAMVNGFVDFFESSVDSIVVRMIGFFAVLVGGWLIHFGLYVA